MDISQVQADLDEINAIWIAGKPYVAWDDYTIIRDHALALIRVQKDAADAIVQMAQEFAYSMYRLESDREFWRLFVPESGKRALGWRMHEWHTPDDHDCRDDPSCMFCNLAVCRVCGLLEGALTTECPGTKVDFETSEKIYRERLDFREGKWVEELSPHRQSCELHQQWKRNRR